MRVICVAWHQNKGEGSKGGGALPISLEMSLFCMDCYSGKNCVSSEGCF